MIKLGAKPPEPDVLSRHKIDVALTFLENQLTKNGHLTTKDFEGRHYWGEVKKTLSKYQRNKCCFCERGIDANRSTDVEHFRPKLAKDDEPAPKHSGYWWLSYTWENLFFVCSECNSTFKKNSFPLINPDDRSFTKDADLMKERPYLLDPAVDDPEEFIIYDYTNRKVPKPVSSAKDHEGRGKKTIEVLGLAERVNLFEDRSAKLTDMEINAGFIKYHERSEKEFGDVHDACINSLKSHTSSRSHYAGFSRFYYNQMGLQKYFSRDDVDQAN